MKTIIFFDDNELTGTVEYFPDEKRVEVTHPDEKIQQKVTSYLTRERPNFIVGECMVIPVEGTTAPTENLGLLDIALNEMYSRIGVHVWWGSLEEFKTRKYEATT